MTDQEWARGLFDRSRGGEEPAWVADHVGMARAGRRRKNVRALSVGGTAVAVVAVAAVVGMSVTGLNAAPEPTTPIPPSAQGILQYVMFNGGALKDQKHEMDYKKPYPIPLAAAGTLTSLIDSLDPERTHLHLPSAQHQGRQQVVADNDKQAKNEASLYGASEWTPDGKPGVDAKNAATGPVGTFSFSFADSGPAPDLMAQAAYPSSICFTGAQVGIDVALDPVQVDGGWTERAQWSKCEATQLPDGSVIGYSTKTSGPYTIVSAGRVFPDDRGDFSFQWANFAPSAEQPSPGPTPGPKPDPKSLVAPSPWTHDQIVAALSAPDVVPGLTPKQAPPAAPGDLKASDFGAGWTVDVSQSGGTTGALVVEDGCTNEQNMVEKPLPALTFKGKTPSGIPVQAWVGWHVMKPGSGPSWMEDLRKHGTGGCDEGNDPNKALFSKDTMSPLPAGIGDDAFIENWVGQGNETAFVREGDSILRLSISGLNYKMPAFTQADKDWLAGLAKKAADLHAGKH